jgi:hypothetical protein
MFELVNIDRRVAFISSGKEEKPVDVLGVDINGDGKIDPSPDGGEIFRLDESFQIGAKHYRLAEANPSELKVAFEEVTEPDYVKAQETLRQAYGLAGALDETLKKKDDLKLAQSLIAQISGKFRAYNDLVRGTPVAMAQTNLDWLATLEKTLVAGDWEAAESSADSGGDQTGLNEQLENLAAIQRAQLFSPVIERVLPFNHKTGTAYCLDFESGKQIEPPARLTTGEIAWDQWCAQSGVDAMAEERKSGPVIWGQRCLFARVAAGRWDTIKPARLVKELLDGHDLRMEAELPNRKTIPATFLFKTRDGGMGVLQVTGFAETPPGTQIRYKLVRADPPNAASSRF